KRSGLEASSFASINPALGGRKMKGRLRSWFVQKLWSMVKGVGSFLPNSSGAGDGEAEG
ncbi:hypothetical protein A2U01_0099619, partial [Trifolium medium]|nr:hypothetical protein [Trifolium medium]